MNCPLCGSKMRCEDSRPLGKWYTLRKYACLECQKVFSSSESLDPKALDASPHKQLKKPNPKVGKLYSGEVWLMRELKSLPNGLVSKIFKVSPSTVSKIWNSYDYRCREGYNV